MEIPMADCTQNPRQKMTYEVPVLLRNRDNLDFLDFI